ncbi:MAG: response regulator [Betaproteobacteria bacterium]
MARVLIVEDNYDSAQTLSVLLEAMGHAVVFVTDPRDAVEVALRIVPDFALIDIGMPYLDGWELAKLMRQEPALGGTRLFALTAYGATEDVQRSMRAGFEVHLLKPVDIQRLQELLAGARARG